MDMLRDMGWSLMGIALQGELGGIDIMEQSITEG